MTEIVDFDGRKVRRYIDAAIDGFFSDPPDSLFQKGYLAALLVIYREAIGTTNDRLRAAEKMTAWGEEMRKEDDD